VHRCTDKLTHALRAVKKITVPCESDQQDELIREVSALVALDHPHIVRLIEYFEEGGELLLVMELLEGPTLGQHLHSVGVFSEALAARCARHMLKALFCCHCNGIAHNDVGADNFQFHTCSPSSPLRMVDFGLASDCRSQQQFDVVSCMDPAAYQNCDMERDIWGAGVILYRMLSGSELFPEKETPSTTQSKRLACTTDPSYVPSCMRDLKASADAVSLLEGMLRTPAAKRLNAREALLHPFITKFYWDASQANDEDSSFSLGRYMAALRKFHETVRLKRLALLVAAHLLTNSKGPVSSINWLFRYVLRDAQIVNAETLVERFAQNSIQVPPDFNAIFASADVSGEGGLTYIEFVATAIIVEPSIFCQESTLRAVFRLLDVENQNHVTDDTLRAAFDVPMCAEGALIREAVGSEGMDYNRFKRMMVPPEWDEAALNVAKKAAWADATERVRADSNSSSCDGYTKVHTGHPISSASEYSPVLSAPSDAFTICQRPGFYTRALRPFYDSQCVSNVVLGLVTGTSSYAQSCARLGLAEVVEVGQGAGAFFVMLNPKYHWDPSQVKLDVDPKLRLVGWWIHPDFVPELCSWFRHPQSIQEGNQLGHCLGDPGDFNFSDRTKPSGYLHTYRDLAGQMHVDMLAALAAGVGQFLERLLGNALGSARLSVGFHFPVRVQYSTLHLQLRVNSGDVCGGHEMRGVDFFKLQSRLEADPGCLRHDDETLLYEATTNLCTTLLAATGAAGTAVEEVGPRSLILL
jgi:serine/threonine protein kinase